MKRKFARLIVRDIRLLRSYDAEHNLKMYEHTLTSTIAKNDLAYELGIITFGRWKTLYKIINA